MSVPEMCFGFGFFLYAHDMKLAFWTPSPFFRGGHQKEIIKVCGGGGSREPWHVLLSISGREKEKQRAKEGGYVSPKAGTISSGGREGGSREVGSQSGGARCAQRTLVRQ